jgi:hypothetical protein
MVCVVLSFRPPVRMYEMLSSAGGNPARRIMLRLIGYWMTCAAADRASFTNQLHDCLRAMSRRPITRRRLGRLLVDATCDALGRVLGTA